MKGHASPSQTNEIDASFLLPLVRKTLKRDVDRVTEWASYPFHGLGGQSVLEFRGLALDEDRHVPWSLVRKRLRKMEEFAERESMRYWRREADAYESGVFGLLDGDFVAVPCLALQDFGDEVWMWMPEIHDDEPRWWSLNRYGAGARHLGQFNANFPDAALPESWMWLSRQWLRKWRDNHVSPWYAKYAHMLIQSEAQGILTEDTTREVERIWYASDEILGRIESQPQCLCHLDAFRRNLFAVGDKTIAIDWAFAGKAAFGEDLAAYVFATIVLNGIAPSDAAEFKELAFAEYVSGLRDAGWKGNERHVRFAYLAHACVRFSCFIASGFLNISISEEERRQTAKLIGTNEDTILDEQRFAVECLIGQHRELWSLLDRWS